MVLRDDLGLGEKKGAKIFANLLHHLAEALIFCPTTFSKQLVFRKFDLSGLRRSEARLPLVHFGWLRTRLASPATARNGITREYPGSPLRLRPACVLQVG